jgi:O-acetyl-ADP-ribose deacetylase (regulator of RNase III)
MTVHIIEGDLLKSDADVIGHQTNCMGVMGSGVAKVIREKYPLAYEQYKLTCDSVKPTQLLGECQVVSTGKGNYVANLFGQLNFGRDKRHTDYDALKRALTDLKHWAKKSNYKVALPYNIGCGLAGGDWKVVGDMIEEVFQDYEVTLYRI